MTNYSSDSRVNDLRDTIMELRKEYKETITEIYRNDPLLHPNKPRYDLGEIEKELKGYYDMIGHCLMIGDSDILYEFGIHPLYRDITLLSGYDKLEAYIKSFQDTFEADDTPKGMKFYLAMLIRALKDLNGESIMATPLLNINETQL